MKKKLKTIGLILFYALVMMGLADFIVQGITNGDVKIIQMILTSLFGPQ